jgi:hypothetical protein
MVEERRKNHELNAIAITIIFYLFRTTLPFLKYPFIILFISLIIYVFQNYRHKLYSSAISYFKMFFLPFALFIIFLFSFFMSDKIFLIIFKDLSNAFILLCLFYLLIIIVSTSSNLKQFSNKFIHFSVIFASFISLLLVFKLLNVFGSFNKSKFAVLFGTLSSDYNFALIPVLFGFIGIIKLLNSEKSLLRIVFLNSGLLLFSIAISLSGSRRGFFVLILLVAFIITVQIFNFFGNENKLKMIGKNARLYISSIILLFSLSWLYAFHTSYYFKKSVFEFIGITDVEISRQRITQKFYKYKSMFNPECNISEVYDDIWFHDSDYENFPDEGWGSLPHKTVFPLKGKNVEIVPAQAQGYLIDNKGSSDLKNDIAYSSTLIDSKKVQNGDTVLASVYCYVSKSFNGGSVKIYSAGSTFGDTLSTYNIIDTSITFPGKEEENYYGINQDTTSLFQKNKSASKNLFQNGNFEMGSLNWLIGSDSTKHEIVNTPFGKGLRISRSDGDGTSFSAYYNGRPIIYYEGHTYSLKFKFRNIKGGSIPFKIGWAIGGSNLNKNTLSLPLIIYDLGNNWKEVRCSYTFVKTEFNSPAFLHSLQDNSIVEVSDVELTDLNRNDSLPLFVDQFMEMEPNRKGIWQKLSFKANCKDGEAPVFLYFSKTGVHDFSSLTGYVIFAYPQYTLISYNKSHRSRNIPLRKSISTSISDAYYLESPSEILPKLQSNAKTANLPYVSGLNFNLHMLQQSTSFSQGNNIQFAGVFPVTTSFKVDYQKREKDILRKFAAELISEDTTYHDLNSKVSIISNESEFAGNRLNRWKFAFEIFKDEYKWNQKIFGGGFNFLNWFGYYFEKSKTAVDYPHNPFLTILLYSGFFGLLIYVFFLYKSILYYLKYFKEFFILILFFLITFLFSFFSAGSPFDPPIMGFFSLLPFLINYINKKPVIN